MYWSNKLNIKILLWGGALFISSFLLFWIQPLIAKDLLPSLGGSPYVWNTNIFYFQAVLLVGYVLSLLILKIRLLQQAILYLSLLLISVVIFLSTLGLSRSDLLINLPILWLVAQLSLLVGVPAIALSMSNILIQSWYSQYSNNKEPFYLFAASNAGSLIALVLFPLLMEPNISVQSQLLFWGLGLAFYWLLIVTLFAVNYTSRGMLYSSTVQSKKPNVSKVSRSITPKYEKFNWFFFAFIPASLLPAVTAYLATDISSFPLLWVITLGTYLLTFILAFLHIKLVSELMLIQFAIAGIASMTVIITTGFTEPVWVVISINLLFLFIVGLLAHSKLFLSKPKVDGLPTFYIFISIGGLAGSIFSTILIPLIFNVLIEYQIILILICFITHLNNNMNIAEGEDKTPRAPSILDDFRAGDIILSLTLFVLVFAAGFVLVYGLEVHPNILFFITVVVPIVLLLRVFQYKAIRFGFCIAAIMLGNSFISLENESVIFRNRNFFGTLKVVQNSDNSVRTLFHGNTIHGRQFIGKDVKCEPISYYSRSGPVGRLMWILNDRDDINSVAVVGLGVGALASYGSPNQQWKFYEINPAVVNIATNSNYFSFISECGAEKGNTVLLGDARKMLELEENSSFQIIFLDAFGSDSIPLHLVTSEAFDMYLSKLSHDGVLAVHISSRFFDLRQPIANLLSSKGLRVFYFDNYETSQSLYDDPSRWIVISKSGLHDNGFSALPGWHEIEAQTDTRLWTDDYSSVLDAIILF